MDDPFQKHLISLFSLIFWRVEPHQEVRSRQVSMTWDVFELKQVNNLNNNQLKQLFEFSRSLHLLSLVTLPSQTMMGTQTILREFQMYTKDVPQTQS